MHSRDQLRSLAGMRMDRGSVGAGSSDDDDGRFRSFYNLSSLNTSDNRSDALGFRSMVV